MPLHLYIAENASGILLLSVRLVAMLPRPPRSHRAARRTMGLVSAGQRLARTITVRTGEAGNG